LYWNTGSSFRPRQDMRYPDLDREHIALLAGWMVAGSVVDGHHHAVRKVSA